MNLTELFILALATFAVMNVWFDGEIFASARAHVNLWTGILGKILECRFCFSHHAAYLILLLGYVPGLFLEEPWHTLSRLPVYYLAIVGLVTMFDGAVKSSISEIEDDQSTGRGAGNIDQEDAGRPGLS